jgi:hypothetical protein
MSDLNIVAPSEDEWDNKIEFVPDTPEPDDALTKEDLLKQVETATAQAALLQEQNAALLQQADSTKVIAAGLKDLQASLAKPAPQAPAEPELDSEALQSEFFETPISASTKLIDKIAGDKFKTLQTNMIGIHLNSSKASVANEIAMTKYAAEVEDVIQSTPADTLLGLANPYKQACDLVAARHLTEILEETKKTPEPVKTTANPPFTETSSVTASSSGVKTKTIRMTPELEKEKKHCQNIGIDFNEYYRRKYNG